MTAYLVGQLITGTNGVYQLKRTRVRTYPHDMMLEKVVSDYRMSLRLTTEFPIMIGTISSQAPMDSDSLTRAFNGTIEIENLAKYRNLFAGSFTIIGGNYTDSTQLESLLGQNMSVKGKTTKWTVGF